MATILKRGNSYRITVSLGYDDNGNQIRKYATYKPKETAPKKIEREVQAFAVKFEESVLNGTYYDGENLTFREFVNIWERDYAKDNLTIGVLDGYKRNLELKVFPEIGNMKISKIKRKNILDVYKHMEENGSSANSIRRTHAMLSGIFRKAYQWELIQDNPCGRVEPPKKESSKGVASFNVEQTYTFLKALELPYTYTKKAHKSHSSTGEEISIKEYTETHSISLQWKVYFNLAIFSGCRRGELIALTWKDIDFKNHTINITKSASSTNKGQIIKPPKTKAGYREITVPAECVSLLRKWKKEQRELSLKLGTYWQGCTGAEFEKNHVFIQDNGSMMHLSSPTHKFKEILEAYNSQYEGDLPLIRLHDLRHTNATLLIAQNTDMKTVSSRLGHSSVATTMDIYAHALPENDQIASNTLESLLLKAK